MAGFPARFALFLLFAVFVLFSSTNARAAHACSANDSNEQCMICNCFYEAASEPKEGKVAVNVVVIARANAANEPGAYCKLIWAHRQFSWTEDNKSNTLTTDEVNSPAYRDCAGATQSAITYLSSSTNPMNYLNPNAVRTMPKWATDGTLKYAFKIGHHVFYNDQNQNIIKTPEWMTHFSTYMKSLVPTGSMFSGATQ